MLSVLDAKAPIPLAVIRHYILVRLQQPVVSPIANRMDKDLETSLIRSLNPIS
jgi:hypothetical protein